MKTGFGGRAEGFFSEFGIFIELALDAAFNCRERPSLELEDCDEAARRSYD